MILQFIMTVKKKLQLMNLSMIVANPQSYAIRSLIQGDICPTTRTTPCPHMRRTMKTMRIPVMQSNKYANWVRCHWCGHTHATITYSATCCLTCKEKYIEIVDEYKHQRRMEWHQQPKQPPIDAVDVVRECPWTKWGLLVSQFFVQNEA